MDKEAGSESERRCIYSHSEDSIKTLREYNRIFCRRRDDFRRNSLTGETFQCCDSFRSSAAWWGDAPSNFSSLTNYGDVRRTSTKLVLLRSKKFSPQKRVFNYSDNNNTEHETFAQHKQIANETSPKTRSDSPRPVSSDALAASRSVVSKLSNHLHVVAQEKSFELFATLVDCFPDWVRMFSALALLLCRASRKYAFEKQLSLAWAALESAFVCGARAKNYETLNWELLWA